MSRWHREILFFNLVAEMALKKFVGIVTYCIENVASHRNFTGILHEFPKVRKMTLKVKSVMRGCVSFLLMVAINSMYPYCIHLSKYYQIEIN